MFIKEKAMKKKKPIIITTAVIILCIITEEKRSTDQTGTHTVPTGFNQLHKK